MNETFRYLTIAFLIISLGIIRKSFKDNKKRSDETIIKQPRIYLNGGIFVTLVSTIINFLVPVLPTVSDETEILVFYIFSSIMIFSGILFIWYYVIWYIKLGKETFLYRSFWGGTKEFFYRDCTPVTRSARVDIYKDGKCIIKISLLIVNWYELSKRIEPEMNKYKEISNRD